MASMWNYPQTSTPHGGQVDQEERSRQKGQHIARQSPSSRVKQRGCFVKPACYSSGSSKDTSSVQGRYTFSRSASCTTTAAASPCSGGDTSKDYVQGGL